MDGDINPSKKRPQTVGDMSSMNLPPGSGANTVQQPAKTGLVGDVAHSIGNFSGNLAKTALGTIGTLTAPIGDAGLAVLNAIGGNSPSSRDGGTFAGTGASFDLAKQGLSGLAQPVGDALSTARSDLRQGMTALTGATPQPAAAPSSATPPAATPAAAPKSVAPTVSSAAAKSAAQVQPVAAPALTPSPIARVQQGKGPNGEPLYTDGKTAPLKTGTVGSTQNLNVVSPEEMSRAGGIGLGDTDGSGIQNQLYYTGLDGSKQVISNISPEEQARRDASNIADQIRHKEFVQSGTIAARYPGSTIGMIPSGYGFQPRGTAARAQQAALAAAQGTQQDNADTALLSQDNKGVADQRQKTLDQSTLSLNNSKLKNDELTRQGGAQQLKQTMAIAALQDRISKLPANDPLRRSLIADLQVMQGKDPDKGRFQAIDTQIGTDSLGNIVKARGLYDTDTGRIIGAGQTDQSSAIAAAQDAISKGASKDAVNQRLKAMGYPTL